MTIRELREKRAKLIADARALLSTAKEENRGNTAEESAQYDEMWKEINDLADLIAVEDRDAELRREEEQALAALEIEKRNTPAAIQTARSPIMQSLRSWFLGNALGDGGEELRALSAGVNVEGGYIVPPEEFVRLLIKALDDMVFIRGAATVTALTGAASVGIPTLDADPADADWTTELQTGSEDAAMLFGKREMIPHPMAKRIKISNQLLRLGAIGVEALVIQRMTYKFGITQEKAYLTGDGDQKPLGLFTASADGIPTSRDVATDNTATAITMDGLKEAKYALKAGYWAKAQWLFHRDAVKNISKLKDLDDQYLWQDSVRAGEPDRLLNFPVMMSEFVPNTFTTGLYVGMVGDFSHYWIVDSLVMQMQRLGELYAETNQTGFIGRYEGDGAPVLGEAFARVTLA